MRSKRAALLLLCGIVLPCVWVSCFENYAVVDVGVFRDWAVCLQEYGREIYLDCPLRPNYPTVGILLTAGVFRIFQDGLGIADANVADQGFRYFLAAFESLNFLLLIALFHLSQFRWPIATALGLTLLPSTWAGAAVWGQIDHLSLAFLLMALVLLLRYWRAIDAAGPGPFRQQWLYCVLIPMSITLYILNKQIALFSFPFLFLLLGITGYKLQIGRSRAGLLQFCTLLLIFVVSFRGLDTVFALEPSYLGSSFIGVWAQGSGHGNIISGDGANLWVLLERDLQSTSHFPLFHLGTVEVKPYTLGIIAYALVLMFLFQSVFKAVRDRSQVTQVQPASDAVELLYFACLFHGISWLGFNLLLTGSHDRHPYLAYVFLLLAIAYYGLNQRRWPITVILFSGFVATAYGLFILSTKSALHPLLFPFRQNTFIATLQLLWWLMLLGQWLRLCGQGRWQRWRLEHFGAQK
ncbi:MAG: hypothetical protein AAGG51_22505 [Cyanobacteria bacterium P01_G01_bin.54]